MGDTFEVYSPWTFIHSSEFTTDIIVEEVHVSRSLTQVMLSSFLCTTLLLQFLSCQPAAFRL